LTAEDDDKPGAAPYAVLSYAYWRRRFGGDPNVVGRTFRIALASYQVVGVAQEGFTGTETGIETDFFLPMSAKDPRTLASRNNYWLRTLAMLNPGVSPERAYQTARSVYLAMREEKAKTLTEEQRRRDTSFREKLLFEPASAGRSNLQRDYRRALTAIAILVALVLLIACANTANLMTAQGVARAREMALRVSIGAGRARLAQLALIESAWIAIFATALGAAFAWWSAPVILNIIDNPENPARLALPADWRLLAFSLGLAFCVTCLFGAGPALRASAVKPAMALRGGEDPRLSGRLMRALIALQIAFCFVVHLVAGLFVVSFNRLSEQPNGFSADRILNLETSTLRRQPIELWNQVADRLRAVPGVEKVGLTVWPMMSGESWVASVAPDGARPSATLSDMLRVSPGWFDVMRIPILAGTDMPVGPASATTAVVNETFVRQFFPGETPVGKWFVKFGLQGETQRLQIVGVARDARSRDDVRRPVRATVYIPFAGSEQAAFGSETRGTFVVRTASANPLALAAALRQEVPRARPEFHVGNVRTQTQIIESHRVRERLLALLALFFAGTALLLAAIGLYGVLDYSVAARRREIGIRMAMGARPANIARGVVSGVLATTLAGGLAGIALGVFAARYIETLLFQVKTASVGAIARPSLTILAAAMLAALPAVMRAARTDPAKTLRPE
jgi:predicted permease